MITQAERDAIAEQFTAPGCPEPLSMSVRTAWVNYCRARFTRTPSMYWRQEYRRALLALAEGLEQ